MILQSIYFADDVGIISSYTNRVKLLHLHNPFLFFIVFTLSTVLCLYPLA